MDNSGGVPFCYFLGFQGVGEIQEHVTRLPKIPAALCYFSDLPVFLHANTIPPYVLSISSTKRSYSEHDWDPGP